MVTTPSCAPRFISFAANYVQKDIFFVIPFWNAREILVGNMLSVVSLLSFC